MRLILPFLCLLLLSGCEDQDNDHLLDAYQQKLAQQNQSCWRDVYGRGCLHFMEQDHDQYPSRWLDWDRRHPRELAFLRGAYHTGKFVCHHAHR